jgi:hypothetical protein
MPRFLKRLILAFIGTPLLALAAWYSFSFLPHLGELNEISSRGSESVKEIENVLYPLAIAGESREGLRSYAVRQAYFSLVDKDNPGRMLVWHANNFLWYGASYLHFNNHELFGIWAQCALLGCAQGLNEVARKYFGKDLTAFSKKELAGIVAVIRSPTRFAPGTEAGEKRANVILERAKTHKSASEP